MTPLQRLFNSVKFENNLVSCASDFIPAMGGSLIQISSFDLMKYRKRTGPHDPGLFHSVYRGFGAYCIEFPDSIYIGSTGGGAMYFGRRWKSHVMSPIQTCLKWRFEKFDPTEIIFHSMLLAETESHARFAEYALLCFAEKYAPQFTANPLHTTDKKNRDRTEHSEKMRSQGIKMTDRFAGQSMEMLSLW